MSQENVEIVRSVYEAFRRGAWDEGARLVDPDVELYDTVGGLSEGSVARGVEEGRPSSSGTRTATRADWSRTRSSTPAIASFCFNTSSDAGGAAESRSSPTRQSSLSCATDAWSASRATWITPRRSKPWGCGSR